MPSQALRVRCRQIGDGDVDAILTLFSKSGFGGTREFWAEALQRLSHHSTPAGFPKYGYLLEVNGVVAGMLLLISSTVPDDTGTTVRCNVSCWYVWPAFRAYGTLLVAQALKHREATYINISPLKHTHEILAAQGYTRYCDGRFTAIPALRLRSRKARIAAITESVEPGDDLSAAEIALLREHAGYGCVSIIATVDGRRHPFVFEPTWIRRIFPVAYLTYSRSLEDFVQIAGPLGRYLAKRGFPFVDLDANGPIKPLVGLYRKTTPKFYRGPVPPRLGDVAYSERIVLALQFPSRLDPVE